MSESAYRSLSRRGFLRRACGCSVALATLPWLGSCDREEPFSGLSIELDRLGDGRSLYLHDGLPVEILREGDEVRARSLLCTHQGCQVQWHADGEFYLCPCHEGRFDPEGRPVAGPPRRTLRDFPVRREGGLVLVDTRVLPEGS